VLIAIAIACAVNAEVQLTDDQVAAHIEVHGMKKLKRNTGRYMLAWTVNGCPIDNNDVGRVHHKCAEPMTPVVRACGGEARSRVDQFNNDHGMALKFEKCITVTFTSDATATWMFLPYEPGECRYIDLPKATDGATWGKVDKVATIEMSGCSFYIMKNANDDYKAVHCNTEKVTTDNYFYDVVSKNLPDNPEDAIPIRANRERTSEIWKTCMAGDRLAYLNEDWEIVESLGRSQYLTPTFTYAFRQNNGEWKIRTYSPLEPNKLRKGRSDAGPGIAPYAVSIPTDETYESEIADLIQHVQNEDQGVTDLHDEYNRLHAKAMKLKHNKKVLKKRTETNGSYNKKQYKKLPNDPKFLDLSNKRVFWGMSRYTCDKIPEVQRRPRGLRTLMRSIFGSMVEVFCSAP